MHYAYILDDFFKNLNTYLVMKKYKLEFDVSIDDLCNVTFVILENWFSYKIFMM